MHFFFAWDHITFTTLPIFEKKLIVVRNRPRSIYNMTGQTYMFGFLLRIEVPFRNWETNETLKKYTILTQKPRSLSECWYSNVNYWYQIWKQRIKQTQMSIFESSDVSVRCYGYLKVLEKITKLKKGKRFWIYWMASLAIQHSRSRPKNISGLKMTKKVTRSYNLKGLFCIEFSCYARKP